MVFSQASKPAADNLHVSGPVVFDQVAYYLSWSSHPNAGYYKQEYLAKGENSEKFKTMMMLEVATGNNNIKDIVDAKVNEIKQMKETNPLVNYELIGNTATGEYLLDFLLSQNNPTTGVAEIVERNVYRYKPYTVNGKPAGVILFAISTRSYGIAITQFLTVLKSNRKELVNKVSQFKIPAVIIQN